MPLDKTAITTMLNAGHASVAHLAKHFEVSIRDMDDFLRENEIRPPNALNPQFRHITKLIAAERPEKVDWESLVFDDNPERSRINGVNLVTVDNSFKVNAKDMLLYYSEEEEMRCFFTDEQTDSVMAFDGNVQNFLVTNLMPTAPGLGEYRCFNEVLPMMISKKSYSFVEVEISLKIHGRFDPANGAVFNPEYIDALVEQWVAPYFDEFSFKDILPAPMPPTPELFALWLWRHLSTVAMMKGLTEISVKIAGVESILSKDLYLQMVVGLMQRAVQSRAIARPSNIILPNANVPAGVQVITQGR